MDSPRYNNLPLDRFLQLSWSIGRNFDNVPAARFSDFNLPGTDLDIDGIHAARIDEQIACGRPDDKRCPGAYGTFGKK
jgi:hypothetical protein